jgi:hypothetical protein
MELVHDGAGRAPLGRKKAYQMEASKSVRMTSAPPPAANETTMVTGRNGQSCAAAGAPAPARPANRLSVAGVATAGLATRPRRSQERESLRGNPRGRRALVMTASVRGQRRTRQFFCSLERFPTPRFCRSGHRDRVLNRAIIVLVETWRPGQSFWQRHRRGGKKRKGAGT